MQAKLILFLLLFILIALCSSFTNADDFLKYNPHNISLIEFNALPEYCKVRLYSLMRDPYKESHQYKRWEAQLGGSNNFQAIHHYCFGLVLMKRADKLSVDSIERNRISKLSIDEFDYVLKRANDKLLIIPEIHFKKGIALQRLGKLSDASREFKIAAELSKRIAK